MLTVSALSLVESEENAAKISAPKPSFQKDWMNEDDESEESMLDDDEEFELMKSPEEENGEEECPFSKSSLCNLMKRRRKVTLTRESRIWWNRS